MSTKVDQGNTIDRREWKRPNLGQAPAPQSNRNAPPDADSDDYFLSNKSQTYGKTAVAGKAGVHHLDGEKTQYAFSLDRGLHQRIEGNRKNDDAPTAYGETLDLT